MYPSLRTWWLCGAATTSVMRRPEGSSRGGFSNETLELEICGHVTIAASLETVDGLLLVRPATEVLVGTLWNGWQSFG